MTLGALWDGAFESPQRYGRLHLTDSDFLARLQSRDGELPSNVPLHGASGRCKYSRFYPKGGCPWCVQRRKRYVRAAVELTFAFARAA